MSSTDERLQGQLQALKLHQILEHYPAVATQAAKAGLSHVDYLARLIEAESLARDQRALDRRLAAARFPVLKTLEGFHWNWPKKINRPQIQNLFRLGFVPTHSNVIFLGGVGIGKTHLATALGHAAVVAGHTVRFAGAIEIIVSGGLKLGEKWRFESTKGIGVCIGDYDEAGSVDQAGGC